MFSEAIDGSQASKLIQETTDILNGMFKEKTKFDPFFESLSESPILDSKFQLTLFSILTVNNLNLIILKF